MFSKAIIRIAHKISDYSGVVTSLLVFPLIIVVVYTVIMRYIFNMPPNWGFEVSLFLYGIFIMMGGAYCLKVRAHVTVDLLPKVLPPLGQKILHFLSTCIIMFVCIIFIWHGYKMAWQSTLILERSIHQSVFNPQIWWFKWMIPLSALLILVQTIAELIETFQKATFQGEEER